MKIVQSEHLPRDKWVLMRDGNVVAVVARGAPIEDADCDAVLMCRADYDEIACEIQLLK